MVFNPRIDPRTRDKLKRIAKATDISLARMVELLIFNYTEHIKR